MKGNIINPIGIFHIVGIGGIGMSAIAKIMLYQGYQVQGSNEVQNSNTNDLENLGIKIFIGHNANNVLNVRYLIISSIIPEDNTEVIQAKRLKIPVLRRHEILSLITKNKYLVAISGSHGKTTTSSIITHLLLKANLNPTSVIGGIMHVEETNAFVGNSKYFILESDESDGTFNLVKRTSTVLTSVDTEHLEYFGSYDNILDNFRRFILEKAKSGFSLVCADDFGNKTVLDSLSKMQIVKNNILSFGMNNKSDIYAYNIRYYDSYSIFDIQSKFDSKTFNFKNIKISIPGKHNVLNALAGIIVAVKLGVKREKISQIIEKFQGVKRRFDKIIEYKESVVIDDYAHHPTEIDAALNTAQNMKKDNLSRVILFFQPHRISRVKALFKEFVNSLSGADIVFIAKIYNIENNISKYKEDSSSFDELELVKQVNKKGTNCYFLEDLKHIPSLIKINYRKNDIFIVMGAGDISQVVDEIKFQLNH